jgi:hypothetical protein
MGSTAMRVSYFTVGPGSNDDCAAKCPLNTPSVVDAGRKHGLIYLGRFNAFASRRTRSRFQAIFSGFVLFAPEIEQFFGRRVGQLDVIAFQFLEFVVRGGPAQQVVLQQGA